MSIGSSWTRQQSHVFWCLLWQTLIDECCLLDRDTQDRRGWHCVQEEDGGEGGDTWVGFEQQNHRQHWSQDRTRLSALLQEMTQIKYFNEKLIDNNWSNITGLLTEMKRLQKVAFDELLPKMALKKSWSTSFYNVLTIWITPNFVSLIFCV